MDFSNQDSNMDFGSDLPIADTDIDIDATSMPDASRGVSVEHDVMIEDINEPSNEGRAQADDEMIDDEFMDNGDQLAGDGDDGNSATMYDDEDLIYEDEDVVVGDEEEQLDVDFKDEDTVALLPESAAVVPDVEVLEDENVDELNETQTPDNAEPAHGTDQIDVPNNDTATADDRTAEEQNLKNTDDENIQLELEASEGQVETHYDDAKKTEAEHQEPTNPTDFIIDANPTPDLGQEIDVGAYETEGEKPIQEVTVPEPNGVDRNVTGPHPAQQEDGESRETTAGAGYGVQLHPVKVQYDDTELCLFPPVEGTDTFFVQDARLAYAPCDRLLSACREVLAESIEESHELVLDFPSLGLHLSSDSSYAKEITLAQILDVYLALCQNDAQEEPAPLQCYVRTRISLAAQYAFLLRATTEGKGLEHIQEHIRSNSSDLDGSSDVNPPEHDVSDHIKQDPKAEDQGADAQEVNSTQELSKDESYGSGEDGSARVEDVAEASGSPADQYDAFDDVSEISSNIDVHPEDDAGHQSDEPGVLNYENALSDGPTNADVVENNEHLSLAAESDSDQTLRGGSHHESPGALTSDSTNGVAVDDFAPQLAEGDIPRAKDGTPDKQYSNNSTLGSSEDNVDHESSEVAVPDAGNSEDGADSTEEADALSENLLELHETEPSNGTNEPHDEPANQGVPDITSTEEGVATVDSSVESGLQASDKTLAADNFAEDGLNLDGEDDLLPLDDLTAVDSQTNKRKAVDEDEFDLLEPETPEKKKHRPS